MVEFSVLERRRALPLWEWRKGVICRFANGIVAYQVEWWIDVCESRCPCCCEFSLRSWLYQDHMGFHRKDSGRSSFCRRRCSSPHHSALPTIFGAFMMIIVTCIRLSEKLCSILWFFSSGYGTLLHVVYRTSIILRWTHPCCFLSWQRLHPFWIGNDLPRGYLCCCHPSISQRVVWRGWKWSEWIMGVTWWIG